MKLEGKRVLLIGLAKTGISTIKFLSSKGAKITVNDIKSKEQVEDILEELAELDVEYILGSHPDKIEGIELVVMSPGVPADIPIVESLRSKGTEVISEIELAYRFSRAPFVGITGTNGKTTTTSLVGEMFKLSKHKTFVVGNIGRPAIEVVDSADESSVLVTELSSFQLESIVDFRPKVSAVLNITPDHLNRHKTMENYIDAKANIFKNQRDGDYTVLNYDCPETRKLSGFCKSKVVFFSRNEKIDCGVYVDSGEIVSEIEGAPNKLACIEDIRIPGAHNLENVLAAVAVALCMGMDESLIVKALKNFEGVEHRLEFVRTVGGVDYVNDSKGTNPDASIKAVEAYDRPLVLIAGGMDKGSEFDEFILSFEGKVKELVLLGETAQKIRKTANEKGFNNCHDVNNMHEAVEKASSLAKKGDIVLLSPACASWDMYPSYEIRGMDFKQEVGKL
ncbi:UDP-N-acetylmuramoylalanine--D-glutamate ligase [Peptoclostridium litorale DSM 5388]|uniref:UDP-N-acetylmuramoylalanine--D-glutamate ligase n=1 Tax=Peptoclostridium litorale DSM 5388 TaxID=1121324 RepID=A0A069RFP9_PEPLI|nr:UDP-N-acetylmuramoyl-L-alanine--D-glutamate ligase [Peptoclostridium litorale]KDR95020.1 UDP-N-acetylmuramoylalanine--D-glutamate ligase MurD [Peptoclostridium litorale DSM 5388]SIN76377.1 UDP-N-acetylmuramoylalanine--D-glutamate ligase [Peptoclostridium litorale DSM 5388]